jgi:V8-like Glu-specific endopeptidase
MQRIPTLPALALAVAIPIGGCDSDRVTDVTDTPSTADDAVLAVLAASGTWEATANPVQLTDDLPDGAPPWSGDLSISAASLAAAAERDRAWYAADGARYEALYVQADGRTYGRRSGVRQVAPTPDASNGFGAFRGVGPASDVLRLEEIGVRIDSSPDRSGGIGSDARITTNWQADRRYRVNSGMTTYPTRVIGNMTGNGDTQMGACSGTKIGPRAVLTAAHCVMSDAGSITFSGRFNPGQTATTTPNGSIPWSGVFLRDYRVHRKYDYAVIYLQDSPATVGLGWMGIGWWNSASGYNGRGSSLFGYPCGNKRGCGGIDQQRCKASPRSDKRCDGWMYGHARTLTTSSFRSDDLLQYDNDMSSGQSGSAVYTWFNSEPMILAVNTHSWSGVSMGPRFRQSMWNDVCSWIAHPQTQSAYATHALCN